MFNNIKDVYQMLEGNENGAEAVAYLKNEFSKLREESAQRRIQKSEILQALGLADEENVNTQIQGIKQTLDVLKQNKLEPSSVSKQLQELTEKVNTLSKRNEEIEAEKQAEKTKRIEQIKLNKVLEALQNNNANNPSVVSKLIMDNIIYDEEKNSITYGENTLEDGVKAFLADNPYLVKNTQNLGSGTTLNNNQGITKIYTREQISNMTPQEINANWGDIQNSLKQG